MGRYGGQSAYPRTVVASSALQFNSSYAEPGPPHGMNGHISQAAFTPFNAGEGTTAEGTFALFQALQAVAAAHASMEQRPSLPPPPPPSSLHVTANLAQPSEQTNHHHEMLHPPQQPSSGNSFPSDGTSERTGEDNGAEPAPMPMPTSNFNTLGLSRSIAGLKLPISCNEIRGVAYMDQQVVACYCPTCSHRVSSGHDRPLFSFTRFERHCGSKAKKWRLSLRIDPGAVPECPASDLPMSLGQWLDIRGLSEWAPRGTIKIGRESESEFTPGAGRTFSVGAIGLPSSAAVWGGAHKPVPHLSIGVKRERVEYETPDLPSLADQETWLAEQIEQFATAAISAEDSEVVNGALSPLKHAAIFRLVYGLLATGEERRAFNEKYLPWLNDLLPHRTEAEFNTLHGYLKMVKDIGSTASLGMMKAYLRTILNRI